jgi:hypothetical protein
MPRLLKWFAFALGLLALSLIGIYLFDRMARCTTNGLAREDALKVANKKLNIDFKENSSDKFVLDKEQFETDTGVWIFSFRTKECTVMVDIDSCGASDIGGITESCVRLQK